MSNNTYNPYQIPASTVASASEITADMGGELLFTTSTTKLVVLSLCTFGFYYLIWFYQNWSAFKRKDNLDIMPLARTLFLIFFVHSLFKRIAELAEARGLSKPASAGAMAAIYIILQLMGRLPPPYFLLTFLSVLPMAHYNSAAIAINESLQPGSSELNSFNWKNWIVVLFGGPLFVLAVIGSFM